jgi:acyl carrier protein
VQEVSVHDSFLEIGGDSLTGTQLLSKLKQNFAVNLPINTVFESPTIAELAKVIDNEQETGEDDMDKISNTAIIGLEWWQIDLGSWIIWILEKTGLIWDVKRPTASMIKARKFSQ